MDEILYVRDCKLLIVINVRGDFRNLVEIYFN